MSTRPTTTPPPSKRRRVKSTQRKGYNFEREVKRRFESLGWFVTRSAGSQSTADLMCLVKGETPVEMKHVALVQCKCTDRPLPKAERRALIEIADRHPLVDVFLARPGGAAGSVELVDLVGGRVYELPPAGDAGRGLRVVGGDAPHRGT